MGCTGGLIILVPIILIFIDTVLDLVDKEIYKNNVNILYLLLVNTSLALIAYIPHYTLYVREKDFSIIFSTLLAFVAAVISNFILVPVYGMVGAALATMFGMFVLLLLKSISAIKFRKFSMF